MPLPKLLLRLLCRLAVGRLRLLRLGLGCSVARGHSCFLGFLLQQRLRSLLLLLPPLLPLRSHLRLLQLLQRPSPCLQEVLLLLLLARLGLRFKLCWRT